MKRKEERENGCWTRRSGRVSHPGPTSREEQVCSSGPRFVRELRGHLPLPYPSPIWSLLSSVWVSSSCLRRSQSTGSCRQVASPGPRRSKGEAGRGPPRLPTARLQPPLNLKMSGRRGEVCSPKALDVFVLFFKRQLMLEKKITMP